MPGYVLPSNAMVLASLTDAGQVLANIFISPKMEMLENPINFAQKVKKVLVDFRQ